MGRRAPEVVVLGVSLAVIAASVLLQPTPEVVTLFGWEVPPLCGMRILTGLSCPGCGLTRSFAFLSHGQLREAFAMNPLGPFAWLLVVAQVPYRSLRLWRGYSEEARVP